jgi:hypothetical protein
VLPHEVPDEVDLGDVHEVQVLRETENLLEVGHSELASGTLGFALLEDRHVILDALRAKLLLELGLVAFGKRKRLV